MKIKHIEQLSGSLDRRPEIINSSSLASEPAHEWLMSYYGNEGTHYYMSASDYYVDDTGTSNVALWSAEKINNDISNVALGLSATVLPPVDNLAELTSSYSSSEQLTDKVFINVEDSGLYRFDSQSSAADDPPRVVEDTDFNGRWYRISLSTDLYARKPISGAGNLMTIEGAALDQLTDSGIDPADVIQHAGGGGTSGNIAVYGDDGDHFITASTFDVANVMKLGSYDPNNSGNIVMNSSQGDIYISSSNIQASTIAIIGLEAANNDIYFSDADAQLKSITGYNMSLLDTFVSGSDTTTDGTYVAKYDHATKTVVQSDIELSSISNFVSTSGAVVEDDIAFFDDNGQLKSITGFNSASFVSGTTGEDDTGKVSTFDGRVLKSTTITANTILTRSLGVQDSIPFFDVNGKLTTHANYDKLDYDKLTEAGEYSTGSGYVATLDFDGKIVKNLTGIHSSDLVVNSDIVREYTIVLTKNDVSTGAGIRTTDMYAGSALPYPIDNSRMTVVSIEGIVYASGSDATPDNEEYSIGTTNATTFNLITSSSYTIETGETLIVSYLSYTSSLGL